MTDNRRVGRRGNPALPQGAIDWAAVDAQAQSLLSPSQLDAFRAVREKNDLEQSVTQYTESAPSGSAQPAGEKTAGAGSAPPPAGG